MNQRLARLSLYASIVLLVIGAFVLYRGYDGVANTTNVNRQLSYLVSGGFASVVLVNLAVIAFVASVILWALDGVRSSMNEVSSSVVRLTEALSHTVFDESGNGNHDVVSVLRGSSSFHLADCRLVEGKHNVSVLPRSEVERNGLLACRVCKP